MPKFLACNLLCLSELSDKKCGDENELAYASHCRNRLVTLTLFCKRFFETLDQAPY